MSETKRPFPAEPNPGTLKLGPLECKILQEVWSRKSLTVRELLSDGNIRLAYTTLMTTLDRLFKKGLLNRTEEGRAFRYSARCAPVDIPRFVTISTMRRWIESAAPSSLPLSCFVEAVGDYDANLLEELRLMVETKRTEIKKEVKKRKEKQS